MRAYLLVGMLATLLMPPLALADDDDDDKRRRWRFKRGPVQFYVEVPPWVRGYRHWDRRYPPPPPDWGYQQPYGWPGYGGHPGSVPPPHYSRRWFKDYDDYEDWLEKRQEQQEEWRERQREAYEDWLEDYEDRMEELRERQRERYRRWHRGDDDDDDD